jgi:hypothetical protein
LRAAGQNRLVRTGSVWPPSLMMADALMTASGGNVSYQV